MCPICIRKLENQCKFNFLKRYKDLLNVLVFFPENFENVYQFYSKILKNPEVKKFPDFSRNPDKL